MSGVRNYNTYSDNLARQRRRRFFIYLILSVTAVFVLIVFGMYVYFYSGWLKITAININGVVSLDNKDVLSAINSFIEDRKWPLINIKPRENIFVFDSDDLKNLAFTSFPVIKEAEVLKYPPHELVINITERTAIGIWCFKENLCRYFDKEGVLWGQAPESSGPLFITVKDLREVEKIEHLDDKWFAQVRKISAIFGEIGLNVKNYEIPPDTIGEFIVRLEEDFYVIFDINSEIERQADVLRVFLQNQSDAFNPEYIDLRIKGRVYYK